MHLTLTDEELIRLIREDVPYMDLTTWTLGIGEHLGRITFSTRHDTIVCGVEETARLLTLCGATVQQHKPPVASGSALAAGERILEATGHAAALHTAWKVAVNMLEYLSGIATSTQAMVQAARQGNPHVQIATTRKVFPGTKSLAIKAVMAGGGIPHRLGLSETVLVFPQHMAFVGGLDGLLAQLDSIRHHSPEKNIAVEVETLEDAVRVVQAGVDVLQVDKMPLDVLRETVGAVRAVDTHTQVAIAAAGGITLANAADYAATGVDILVTSALYAAKPADIAAQIVPLGGE
jgi:molybdenum transport protein